MLLKIPTETSRDTVIQNVWILLTEEGLVFTELLHVTPLQWDLGPSAGNTVLLLQVSGSEMRHEVFPPVGRTPWS
jgi:hypothetical protein